MTNPVGNAALAIESAIARQRAAHRADPSPALATRRARLRALVDMLRSNRSRIRSALLDDYGVHPPIMTDLIEIAGAVGRAHYALENLDQWAAAQDRAVDAAFGAATARMEWQPKGVIGNIVPWNFPFEIGVGPLTEMLAAGNRVIVKPSELTPACSALLAEMVAKAFDPDVLTVIEGDQAVAEAFAAASWDHLLFTGSTAVGKAVMRAAAERLTPLTLELGSKSPAILTPTGVTRRAVDSIIGLKLAKSGQVCVSADHVFVPANQLDAFIALARAYFAERAPGFTQSADCTAIISGRHFDRLQALLADAVAKGGQAVVVEAGAQANPQTRQMPLTVVTGVRAGMRIADEEIFGPILPVITYTALDEVIDHLWGAAKPLSIYIFGNDRDEIDRLAHRTVSGGITVNGAALNTACISLGFGGVGASGFGRHHGVEGFREFSNHRAVFVRGAQDHADIIFPPYGAIAEAAAQAALG